eukprot:4892071-Prymnesium_polylepis.1
MLLRSLLAVPLGADASGAARRELCYLQLTHAAWVLLHGDSAAVSAAFEAALARHAQRATHHVPWHVPRTAELPT